MHEPSRSRSLTMLSLTFLVAVMAMVAPSMAEAADHESLPGPAVVRFSPVRGEEMATDGHVEVLFDRAMNQASVESGFSLQPETGGILEWIDARTLRFRPFTEWARDVGYVVHISTEALDATGLALESPFDAAFRTVGFLEVTHITPADGTTEIAVDATILLIFNRPVVALTAISDPGYSSLPQPICFDPEIAGSGEWLNPATYVFRPTEPLAGGTTYKGIVAAGLTDITGGLLASDVIWQFTTERPRVVWTSPSRGDDLVPIDTEIRVTFNMPIALATAIERFSIQPTSLLGDLFTREVAGTLSVDGNDRIFSPSEPLSFDREYTVTLDSGVVGRDGGLATTDSTVWRFRTVPLPRIIGTSPRDGESSASSHTSFVIQFNAPIDPETVMPNVTIEPAPDPADVTTYFRSWDNTFVIRFGAEPSHEYTFRIDPGIADPYGNVIDERLTIRFRTAPLAPTAWLHLPGRVGTLSTSEPARLFVGHRNTDRLRLTLTRLTVDEYFAALSDWYRFSPPKAGEVRSWTVSVSSPLNEAAYTPTDLLPEGVSLDAGIYVIDLDADGVSWDRWQHRHLLIVSPINLTVKTTENETLVWATDLSSGAPVPGLILWAYDGDGNQVDVTITDSHGIGILDGLSSTDWRGLTVVGRSPFVLCSPDWDDGISRWEFGFGGASDQAWRVHLDTDRPIYRAGQTVFFRGILRAEDDARYTLPSIEEIHVTIRDSVWDLVYEETLAVDEFGVFSDALDLPEGAALGDYHIETRLDDQSFSASFQVAAYRAPEFAVVVTPSVDELAAGQPIDAVINASYFFGAPVAGVDVQWRVVNDAYRFTAPQFGRYTFTDDDDAWTCWSCWWWTPPAPPSPVIEGEGKTDDSGDLLIRLPADIAARSPHPEETLSGSRVLTVEATATGRDGQTLSGRARIIVHQADHYVGLASDRAIGRATEEMTLDVITVGWNGERIPERTIAYTVFRREWINEYVEDEAGGGEWTWTTNDIEIATGTVHSDGFGEAVLAFVPPEGGSYKIVAESFDAAGRPTRSSRFVWVTGPETVSWRRSNDDRITLISDKTSYLPGETAEILIPSPYPGSQWALITVERGGILSREVVQLPSNSSVVRLPITQDHIPNVYVSVVLIQGRDAALAAASGGPATADTKVGYVAISVDPLPKTLRIEMTPSAGVAEPGDRVEYRIHVTDSEGRPVEASLSLDLVDKAILTLKPRTADAVVSAFYGARGLGVRTASGLSISIGRLVLEQLEDAGLFDEEQYAGAGDATSGAAAPMAAMLEADETVERSAEPGAAKAQLPAGIEVREEFADTAFWNPSIETDSSGRATVSIDLPDNLTTWAVRAVGVTRATEVGEETSELLVTKPLLIRPVAPRFLVVGDHVRLAALVSNQTDESLVVEVTLGQTGLALVGPVRQTLTIPATGEREVAWWATVQDVRQVDLAFSAVSGDLADAARPRLATGPDGTLPVYRYTAPETVGTAGQLTEAGSRTEGIVLPPNMDPDRSTVTVRLDPSLAAAMQDGLSYLEHFEYECTEQVVSRFLPNALTYRALAQLGIEDEALKAKLETLIPEGLEKLYQRQNSDGGWGWWDGDRSSPTLTAYAVFGLLRVREVGFTVRDSVIELGLDALERSLLSRDNLDATWEANRQAWILYVMALGGRSSAITQHVSALFEDRAKLSHYAKAYLALSMALIPKAADSLETLTSDLVNAAIFSATGAHWEEASADWWAMNTDTRSTAIILDALVQLDPDNPLLANIVRWLMVARRDGIWETTQETAWALIALTDWMVATGELRGSFALSASLNRDLLHEGRATPETIRESTLLTVRAAEMLTDEMNRLTISRGPGEGRLYYSAHLSVHLPVEDVEPLDRGIIVYRQYLPADDASSTADVGTAQIGESIRVRLTIIAPHDLYYAVVEDPIPAGCEAIDTSLDTASLFDEDPGLFRETESSWRSFYWWWWRWYSRTEMRDEKVVLFADYLSAGTYTYEYSLRAVQPGEYRVLPTSAYEFYFPEVFGRSDGRLFTVLEAD